MQIPGAQAKNDDHRRKARPLYFLKLHQENDRFNNKRGFFGFFIVYHKIIHWHTDDPGYYFIFSPHMMMALPSLQSRHVTTDSDGGKCLNVPYEAKLLFSNFFLRFYMK